MRQISMAAHFFRCGRNSAFGTRGGDVFSVRLPMQMLAEISAVCCVILLLSIVALWRNMRKARPAAVPERKPVRSERRRQHPRMDLAAGMVASSQTVRERSRGQGVQKQNPEAASGDSPLRRRSDRAYFNSDMGDLRDPDVGITPAGGVLRPTGSLSKPEYR